MEFTVLNHGVKMPMEGFGVFQVADQAASYMNDVICCGL